MCGSPGGVVDQSVLQERAEDEEDTHTAPHVNGFGVGHRRQRVLDAGLPRKKEILNLCCSSYIPERYICGSTELLIPTYTYWLLGYNDTKEVVVELTLILL